MMNKPLFIEPKFTARPRVEEHQEPEDGHELLKTIEAEAALVRLEDAYRISSKRPAAKFAPKKVQQNRW